MKKQWWLGMAMAGVLATSLSACAEKSVEKKMELTVVVFNYWPRPIADVTVDGQWAGGSFGSYGLGGTGGSLVCCAVVKPGPVKVAWVLDGNGPRLGEAISVMATLSSIPRNAKYLSVHIYPDSHVELIAGNHMTDERPPKESK